MEKAIRFEFTDLKLFCLVAEHGSLSHAAQAMPLALSAASARIKALEARLETALFERKPRGVVLTHAGKQFLEYAQSLLRAARDAQRGMEALTGKGRNKLSVFSNTTGMSTDLPNKLGEFLSAHPEVDIDLTQCASKEVLKSVQSGEADLGIVDGDYNQRELLFLLFQRNELIVVAHPDTELGQLPACRFKEWLQYPLIGYLDNSSLQQFIERMSLLNHISGSFRAKVPDFNSVASLVASNVGVAIMPRPIALQLQSRFQLTLVPLDEPWANRELHVCVRPELENNVVAFRLARYLSEGVLT